MHKILATILLLGICQFQLVAQSEEAENEKIGKGDVGVRINYANPKRLSIGVPVLVTDHISLSPAINFLNNQSSFIDLNPTLLTRIYFPYVSSTRFFFNNEIGVVYNSSSDGSGGISLLMVKLGLGLEYYYKDFSIGAGGGFTTKRANNFLDNCSNSVFNNCTAYLEVSGTIYLD